jgi:hypothetical protein
MAGLRGAGGLASGTGIVKDRATIDAVAALRGSP